MGTDAGDLGEPTAAFISTMPSQELSLDLVDPSLQLGIVRCLEGEQFARQDWQGLIGGDLIEQRSDVNLAGGRRQAKLSRIAADGVGQLRAVADQPIAHAHEHQRRLLLGRLDRHKPHRRPAHRLAQRFRVGRVVLTALDVRLDQLRRDQLHLVAERLKQPRPVVGGRRKPRWR